MLRHLCCTAVLLLALAASGAEIGWIEDYVLADDRLVALDGLVPGTDEHRYWTCITLQHLGRLDEVDRLLDEWRKQKRPIPHAERIGLRQAALRFAAQPERALPVLRRELSPSLGHQQPEREATAHRPTVLDPRVLSWEQVRSWGQRYDFTDAAIERLLREGAEGTRLRHLLDRLQHANIDGIERLIVQDLKTRDSAGFGSLKVHHLLTTAQLETVLRLHPPLHNQDAYVHARLQRLLPPEGVDLERDLAAYDAWLARVAAYTSGLASSQSSLQALVLYHQLARDLARGEPDRERFLAYLKLPRNQAWVDHEHRRRHPDRQHAVNVQYRLDERILPLHPIHDDEELVHACLAHVLRDAADPNAFAAWIDDGYLKRVFVETKVLAGIGDETEWSERLRDPGFWQRLKDRIDIDFLPTNPTWFGAGEAVELEVAIKNVDELLLRVYEIDTVAWHRGETCEVRTDIELGGLIPNLERRIRYEQPPLRRHVERFALPELSGRGVWVVELIGRGTASRAVIRKGDLTVDEQPSTAGMRFTVRDEQGMPLPAASLWLRGRLFAADEQGSVLIPFTTEPGPRQASIEHQGFARPLRFAHLAEDYRLELSGHIDSEALVAGTTATLVLHPRLTINDLPTDLGRLTDVVLTISAIDRDGVRTDQVVRDPELSMGAELLHRFRMPERLRQLEVGLSAHQPLLTGPDPRVLEAGWSTGIGRLDAPGQAGSPLVQWHLERRAQGYALRALGRNGEPTAGLRCVIELEHRLVTHHRPIELETDAAGRIELGPLPDVLGLAVQAQTTPGIDTALSAVPKQQWTLDQDATLQNATVHLPVGAQTRLPYVGEAQAVDPEHFACYEIRGGSRAVDRLAQVALSDGFLTIGPFEPGSYRLHDKAGRAWTIRVEAGVVRDDLLIGAHRRLELDEHRPVHLDRHELQGEQLRIHVADADALTRVHVLASHFVPAARGRSLPGTPIDPGFDLVGAAPSHYLEGRAVGDEERYILARRDLPRFPGVMLERPSLLLNPWAVGETSRQEQHGGPGGAFAERSGGGRRRATGAAGGRDGERDGGATGLDLDFLAAAPASRFNLQPDADGWITVDLGDLRDAQLLIAVAVHPLGGSRRTIALPARNPALRDRRLALAIDPDSSQARQPAKQVLQPGEQLVIPDIGHAELRSYSSLSEVHALLSALQPGMDKGLEALLRWPELDAASRDELYREHACHELHLFLYHKDRAFFDAVIRPYLADKRDKDLIDRWLLDEDLGPDLRPEAWQRLNAAERALVVRRLVARAPAALQWFDDVLELVVPDPVEAERRLRTALRSSALGDDDGGLRDAKEELARADIRRKGNAEGAAMPPAAAPAPTREALTGAAADKAGRREESVAMDALGMIVTDDLLLEKAGEWARSARQFYRAVEPTRIWAESRYHRVRLAEQTSELVPPNAFWRALAATPEGEPFRSAQILDAIATPTEAWLALAVLDLPFTSAAPELAFAERAMTLTAQAPTLVFASDLRPAAIAEGTRLLVNQQIYDAREPERRVGNRTVLNAPAELVMRHPYGQRVVLTNPTQDRLQLDLLLQIPAGAIALDGGPATRIESLLLGPYQTQTRDLLFYFPEAGAFAQHPATSALDGAVVGRAEVQTLQVLPEPTRLDTERWDHVAAFGDLPQVLAWLRSGNLQAVDLSLCAWRLRDPDAYQAITRALAERLHLDATILGYAFLHGDASAMATWIRRHPDQAERFGPSLDSPWLAIDQVDLRRYEHLEFTPLVNPRAHAFTDRRQIENHDLHRHYHRLLEQLSHQPRLDDEDRLALVYYLLVQDRFAEAIAQFALVDRERIAQLVQHDYASCWLAMARSDLATARSIAERHAEHPIDRWRKRFAAVLAQLGEIEGGDTLRSDPRNREQGIEAAAEQAPSLELEVVDGEVRLAHRNLATVELRCYPMDVELLFSRDPFLGEAGLAKAALIKPNHSQTITCEDDGTTALPLPEDLQGANLLLEVVGGGLRRSESVLANRLAVRAVEEYAQLQVTDRAADRPLGTVYVKVYRREGDGSVHFHKDGYTDLRGRFDYATVSGEGSARAERFAILVLDSERGAVIRELAPPTR